uniref:Uncharacterized protein n=1 Tax=Nelumbo nucifera TaxID=4432 RepID=A0A822YD55_NELNU|nr:TPA_asm: hypothetical protein HUJ06_030464 [Nelumbo nucifera]
MDEAEKWRGKERRTATRGTMEVEDCIKQDSEQSKKEKVEEESEDQGQHKENTVEEQPTESRKLMQFLKRRRVEEAPSEEGKVGEETSAV